MAVIPSTLELAEIWVSPSLVEEAHGRTDVKVGAEAIPMPFNAANNLEQAKLFPNSVRGRRAGHKSAVV
jgi:hypothetical protein